jgi:hypothetical protein
MNLQSWYDLEVKKRESSDTINKEVSPLEKKAA